MTTVETLTKAVSKLFMSRNQTPVPGCLTTWVEALTKYDINVCLQHISDYIIHGDDFPSLPKLIEKVEGKKSAKLQAIDAWANIRKYAKERKSGMLSETEKKAFYLVCPDGLNEWIEADNFRRGTIEREFKTVYTDIISGTYTDNKKIDYTHNKQINMTFADKRY